MIVNSLTTEQVEVLKALDQSRRGLRDAEDLLQRIPGESATTHYVAAVLDVIESARQKLAARWQPAHAAAAAQQPAAASPGPPTDEFAAGVETGAAPPC